MANKYYLFIIYLKMSFTKFIKGLTGDIAILSQKLAQMSPEHKAEQVKIVVKLREQIKKILSSRELTLQEVLQKNFWLYFLTQRKFANCNSIWSKHISYWDFNFRHICAIVQQMRKLPHGTIILSPIAGNCFLEAILERLGFQVLANDIKDRGFTFMTAPISHMDGMAFVSQFVAANPSVPFVLLMSWAPMMGHDTPEIGTHLMQFAATTKACQCVFHISEGRGGCTDVVATFDVIDRHFREVWRFERYPSFSETISIHEPLHDALSCLVPARK
jgi:hypothetical protein